ncbi:type II toxin-antitoxin system HicA family toxin [Fimbriimonas ginsengisoli]|uniref:YcfA family protein n=1 Tax=Fimbriimonas ginsengisoli Gsoil 348 TaxID=661478 RepID=A0A068NPF8_FIMGI|nr:YcfA family protein [Fimbriimonas ginsengisoli Gsoil 348]
MQVRDLLDKLRKEGWVLDHQSGSHRQFVHPTKPGIVTVPGPPNKEIPPGTLNSIKKQAGWK